MKLANKTCNRCGHAVFKYGLFFWNFYERKWNILKEKVLCPKCDKAISLIPEDQSGPDRTQQNN